MRSGREILFRLRQEAGNYWLYRRPPELPDAQPLPAAPLAAWPDPAQVARRLQGTPYATNLLALADRVLDHRFELLGHQDFHKPAPIAWRCAGAEGTAPLLFFRRIPYLDVAQVGDQKMVWEINRHAHLVLLAQAGHLSGDPRYTRRLVEHLEDWWRANPFQQGINYTAALEVALRALAWTWVYHLAGHGWSPAFRRRLLTEIYRHGWHLEYNLSLYASPNTHLLGEAVALHAIAALFPALPTAPRWRPYAARIIASHMRTHTLGDGMYFEQSTYYHVYALDMFLFHALLEPVTAEYRAGLARMAELTASVAGPGRALAFFGDDDGGRLFHPYGRRAHFCRGSLAAAGRWLDQDLGGEPEDAHEMADWWLAQPESRGETRRAGRTSQYHAGSGLVTFTSGSAHAVLDAGAFGAGTAGHSHADTLSLVAWEGDEPLLLDPGTYCYLSDPAEREWFRSTAAHNTICVDGANQAEPVNLFRWTQVPEVEVLAWQPGPVCDWLHACCRYRGLVHHRRAVFLKQQRRLALLDQVTGEGHHQVEQFWHTGPQAVREEGGLRMGRARLISTAPAQDIELLPGRHSPAYGVKQPGRTLRVRQQGALPLMLGAVLDWEGRPGPVSCQALPDGWRFCLPDGNLTLPAAPGDSPRWEPFRD